VMQIAQDISLRWNC